MPTETPADDGLPEERRAERSRQRIEFLSAVLLALTTVATAWSAYQSSRWGGEAHAHQLNTIEAIVKTAKFTTLAEQKMGLHTTLFGQWVGAVGANDKPLAEYLVNHFPEPLRTATTAWQLKNPSSDAAVPSTPFSMPEYVLSENAEAQRWEDVSIAESKAAEAAGDTSDRYLLFTVIFASVLFFGGISGKFGWQAMDVTVLVLGALALLVGLSIMFLLPVQ